MKFTVFNDEPKQDVTLKLRVADNGDMVLDVVNRATGSPLPGGCLLWFDNNGQLCLPTGIKNEFGFQLQTGASRLRVKHV